MSAAKQEAEYFKFLGVAEKEAQAAHGDRLVELISEKHGLEYKLVTVKRSIESMESGGILQLDRSQLLGVRTILFP